MSIERKIRVNAFYCAYEWWQEDATRHCPIQTMYLQYTPFIDERQAMPNIRINASSPNVITFKGGVIAPTMNRH